MSDAKVRSGDAERLCFSLKIELRCGLIESDTQVRPDEINKLLQSYRIHFKK